VAEISIERREENLFRNKLLECVSRTPRGSSKQGRFHHLANEKPMHLPIGMESLLRSKKPRRKLAQTHWREADKEPSRMDLKPNILDRESSLFGAKDCRAFSPTKEAVWTTLEGLPNILKKRLKKRAFAELFETCLPTI